MEKEYAEKEIQYQLCKLLLFQLQREHIIDGHEAEHIRQKLVEALEPPIGQLEVRHL